MSSDAPTVACNLTHRDAERQALEWTRLQPRALRSEALPTGARVVFPADLAPTVTELAEREAACCAFLDITTTISDDVVVVEITSSRSDARFVISALSGVDLS